MTKKKYRFELCGTGAGDVPWTTRGEVDGTFPDVPPLVIKESFLMLTQGRAEYGKPGQGGCRGPYHIKKMRIEEMEP